MYTERLSEALAVVSTIDPVSQSAATVTGDIIDMSKYSRLLFVLSVGALGASATVDYLIQGSAASNMGSPATITGKSITQLTKAGSDDNKQVIVEVTAEEVAAQGFRYVRDSLTVATAACLISVVVLGLVDVTPASALDLATVDEIVG